MPIKFSPCATNPCVATPNRGHVPTKPCTTTNRAACPSESCKKNIQAEPHELSRRAPVQAVVMNRRAVHTPEHSAMHSAVHTLDTRTRPLCPSTRPCIRSTHALGRAHARHAHSTVHTHTRPCTRLTRVSTVELGRAHAQHAYSAVHTPNTRTRPWNSVLHTLIYEQYVLLLLIYL